MPSEQEIAEQQNRLAIYRQTLSHYLTQQAIHSSAYAPPSVASGIVEARAAIRRIKAILREWSAPFVDHPDDGPQDGHEELVYRLTQPRVNVYMPFRPNLNFVGREEMLEQIHTAMKPGEPVGLIGMGGIGKTQLAVEYAYRYQAEYPNGIFWISDTELSQATSAQPTNPDFPEILAQGFAEIAKQLYPNLTNHVLEEQIRIGYAHLQHYQDTLLIVDNLHQPAYLQKPIVGTLTPGALPCYILFTTRHYDSEVPFQYIDVHGLTEPAALVLLLQRRVGVAYDEFSAARQICRKLGYLPLGLKLASAFLSQRPRVSLAGYLKRLRREGAFAALGTPLAAVLKLQWSALTSSEARRTLRTGTLFGESANVSRAHLSLLTSLSEEAEDGYDSPFDEALLELRNWSLIEEMPDGDLRLHPLVREFVMQSESADEREMCRVQVETALLDALEDPERRRAQALLVGECLSQLTWSSPKIRLSAIAALRELMQPESSYDRERRNAAFLLTQLRWLDETLPVSVDDIILYLELIARYIHTKSQNEYLVQQIDTFLNSRASHYQQAQLRVFRAVMRGKLGDLSSAYEDYERARELANSILDIEGGSRENLKLKARIDLGIGNIIGIRAERLTEPQDKDRKLAELRQAACFFLQAARAARAYGRDIILEVGIGMEIIYIFTLLQRWHKAEKRYALTLDLLRRNRAKVQDQAVYAMYKARIQEVASRMYYEKGRDLIDQQETSQALVEYMEAYQLVSTEIEELELGFQQLHDPILAHDLAFAYLNAGDYLRALSECFGCTIEKPTLKACKNWMIAANIARRFGLSDDAAEIQERIDTYCTHVAVIDLDDTRWPE